ncbi:MAG: hypothetical protein ACKOET_12385 [Verrucomicrobiota bacterium]
MKSGIPRTLPELEHEILGYLLRNPAGEDSIEGIVEWWLLEQRLVQAHQEVRQALAALHTRGFVEERTAPGGTTIYRLRPDLRAAAGQPPPLQPAVGSPT